MATPPTESTPSVCDSDGLRQTLKLDFTNAPNQLPLNVHTSNLLTSLLGSPDVDRLTRDLIAYSNTLPTPTPTKLLYPSEVTSAQRNYAQGFVDALRSIQQVNGFRPTLLGSPSILNSISFKGGTSPTGTPTGSRDFDAIVQAIQLAQEKEKTPAVVTAAPSTSAAPVAPAPSTSLAPIIAPPELKRPKSENSMRAQSEDSLDYADSSRMNTPQLDGSVDMDDQEMKKLIRKRERNRAAASKCRQKKLERIQELEQLVNQEMITGKQLDQELETLKQKYRSLQTRVQAHKNSGCDMPYKILPP